MALDRHLASTVVDLFGKGWTPLDLHEAAQRKFEASAAEHLMCVVAQQTAGRGAVHFQWAAQVAALSTSVDGGSLAWSVRTGRPWLVVRAQLIDLLALLASMPRVETVLPAPGSAASTGSVASSDVDERVLRKVRRPGGLRRRSRRSRSGAVRSPGRVGRARQLTTRWQRPSLPSAECQDVALNARNQAVITLVLLQGRSEPVISKSKMLLDEMLSGAIAAQLRATRHDASAVVEDSAPVGSHDEDLLGYAASSGRWMVTANVRDFASIHSAWASRGRSHAGLIYIVNPVFPSDQSFIGGVVTALDDLITCDQPVTGGTEIYLRRRMP